MNEFSTPRRMSPGAFVIIFVKSFREIAGASIVAFLYLMFRSDDSDSSVSVLMKIALAIGIFIAFSLLTAFLRFYFRKFHIEEDKLVYSRGIAQKRTTSIPLSRIHNLRTKRGLVYRILNMRGVTFDTLATDKEEVELILDESDWQSLLSRVKSGENIAVKSGEEGASVSPPPHIDDTILISNAAVIKGALCQNHLKGFAVLSTILLPVLDKLNDFGENNTERVIDFIESHAGDTLPTIWQWATILVALYLVIIVLLTGKILLRYGDMAIKVAGSKLTIESGLISRFTSRLSRDKATILSIKQNPVEKAAGCETVTLRQANNATDSKAGGNITIYGAMPGKALLDWWLGNSLTGAPMQSARSGAGLFYRKSIPWLLAAIAGAVILIFAADSPLSAVIICPAAVVFGSLRAAMALRHSRITLYDSFVKINRGNIAYISEYIRYSSIEATGIRKTPFSRFTGRVTLSLSTNAGAVKISSLRIGNARALRNTILNKAVEAK